MGTLSDFIVLFPKGQETAVGMSQQNPGPFPCPSGDIISPFGMFEPPAKGTRRAFRLKAVYFDENAGGDSHIQIYFQMFSGARVTFTLPRVCSAGGASNFHFSDWYMPDMVDTSYAHSFAQFVGRAPYNNTAGVYSLIIEAHDIPFVDGMRVRDDSTGGIYLMLDSAMRHIPSPDVYHRLFAQEDYKHLQTIAPYPVGSAIPGDAYFASGPDGSTYFIIEGAKRRFASQAVTGRFGINWNAVEKKTAEELAAIPDGPPIQ